MRVQRCKEEVKEGLIAYLPSPCNGLNPASFSRVIAAREGGAVRSLLPSAAAAMERWAVAAAAVIVGALLVDAGTAPWESTALFPSAFPSDVAAAHEGRRLLAFLSFRTYIEKPPYCLSQEVLAATPGPMSMVRRCHHR